MHEHKFLNYGDEYLKCPCGQFSDKKAPKTSQEKKEYEAAHTVPDTAKFDDAKKLNAVSTPDVVSVVPNDVGKATDPYVAPRVSGVKVDSKAADPSAAQEAANKEAADQAAKQAKA